METVTKIKNIMVNLYEEKCAYEKFYNKSTDNENYLITWGKMGVFFNIIRIKSNIKYCIITYTLLQYAQIFTYYMLKLCMDLLLIINNTIWIMEIYY